MCIYTRIKLVFTLYALYKHILRVVSLMYYRSCIDLTCKVPASSPQANNCVDGTLLLIPETLADTCVLAPPDSPPTPPPPPPVEVVAETRNSSEVILTGVVAWKRTEAVVLESVKSLYTHAHTQDIYIISI